MTRVLLYEYISGGGCADAQAACELLPMGRAMRDAIAADLARVPGVSVTVVADASEIRTVSPSGPSHYLSPGASSNAIELVRNEARRHDAVWVIAPETDDVLAAFCAAVEASRWIGCDAASIHIAGSKRRTSRHLAQAGIATTRAWSPGVPLRPGPGAWVVKPDDGAGCVDTRFYSDFRAAECAFQRRAASGERVTWEEWVEGDALSLSLLCAQGSAGLLGINRQHIGVTEERVTYDGVSAGVVGLASPTGRACASLASRVAHALPGLAGFVGIDVVLHRDRGPVVIEINPRVTCAYPALSAGQHDNLAARILDAHRRGQEPGSRHVA